MAIHDSSIQRHSIDRMVWNSVNTEVFLVRQDQSAFERVYSLQCSRVYLGSNGISSIQQISKCYNGSESSVKKARSAHRQL